MVVLLGDGIESLFPNVDMFTIRVGSFLVLTPMLFLPIRKLAYTSLIGIISCACLVTIVLYDGFSKKTKPGSLIEPMVRIYYIVYTGSLFFSFFFCNASFFLFRKLRFFLPSYITYHLVLV